MFLSLYFRSSAETLNLVADVATQNKFYDYEVHDVAHIIETESATALANPKVTVFEGLHRAAFRGTLVRFFS